jgi:hypothetical protein
MCPTRVRTVDDPLGLLRALHKNGALGFHLATRPAADQGFGQGAFAGGVDRVDVAHHRRAAAVILVEHHRIRLGEVPGKVADVLHLGTLEGVNGLGVVAHDGQKGVRGNQLPQNGDLNVIGVLILVDIDVGILKLDEPADVLVLLQGPHEIVEQFIEIKNLILLLQCRVDFGGALGDFRQFGFQFLDLLRCAPQKPGLQVQLGFALVQLQEIGPLQPMGAQQRGHLGMGVGVLAASLLA